MLTDRILAGDIRAAARLMRLADDRDPAARTQLAALFPHTGRAHIVGITGNPGAGKSTLVDMLVKVFRSRGRTVGVVAIDPSSPFTGGAILGDRIRMQRHAEDPGVFIRSLATRGHLGGLTRSTSDVVTVLDAMGFDLVLIETVGVGQDEVDIVRNAHTSVVVLVPGLGDEIQIMKAGLLEIADIFSVNKADRPGVERVLAELETLQRIVAPDSQQCVVPILKTVASRNEGITELADAVEQHGDSIRKSGTWERREGVRLSDVIHAILRERMTAEFETRLDDLERTTGLSRRLLSRTVSPYDVAEKLLAALLPPDKVR